MPPERDTTRRQSKKRAVPDEENDLEGRRARGEISCAECRRLKLRCDKQIPCASCIRRGCPSICPNGSLSGQGTRFVLADTPELHGKITLMSHRIRQLEDALAVFQATVSTEAHPLMIPELLAIKYPPDNTRAGEATASSSSSTPLECPLALQTLDALGTLTISETGEAKYFGRTGGTEAFFEAGASLESSSQQASPMAAIVPLEIASLSNAFPFNCSPSSSSEHILRTLYDWLPDRNRGWSLCETYLEHGTWAFQPLLRDEIVDDCLMPIYKARKENDLHAISPHRLAVLFIIFAHGSLLDLTLPPFNDESDKYYHLARAALSLRSVFDSPEIATVQATALVALFHSVSGKQHTFDSSWAIISLAAKLAQGLGLHRDSTKWDMDAKTVQRRHILFNELSSSEMYFSLALGRSPSVRQSYVDCPIPKPEGQQPDDPVDYFEWKHEFCRDILSTILEILQSATPPPYQTILDVDKRVRDKTIPSHLNTYMRRDDPEFTPLKYMRGTLIPQYRATSLIFLHRSYFAQAMLDHADNPMESPYKVSFLAAHKYATIIVKASFEHFDRMPELCFRWLSFWVQLLSAATILVTIVIKSPHATVVPDALTDLARILDLFRQGSHFSQRIHSGMAVLSRLYTRALQISTAIQMGSAQPPSSPADDEALLLLGGKMRLLTATWLKKHSECAKARNMFESTLYSRRDGNGPDPDPMQWSLDFWDGTPSATNENGGGLGMSGVPGATAAFPFGTSVPEPGNPHYNAQTADADMDQFLREMDRQFHGPIQSGGTIPSALNPSFLW